MSDAEIENMARRLRENPCALCRAAAATLEYLQAELERLRKVEDRQRYRALYEGLELP